ncbi:MAG: carbonic anhydrase [Pseudomonadota bacterium]|nr:carbonic anhydrase [Pseudomonadota bacterium]
MNQFVRLALLGVVFVLSGLVAVSPAFAVDMSAMSDAEKEKIRLIVKEVIREYAASLNEKQGHGAANSIVSDIRQANANFMRSHGPAYFKPFLDSQHPRATVITCSDSRVHTHALDASPDGDLFMVRNIGNQMATAEGSIEYGVHHLHTPLLLFIGHTACGAIKAASSDYSKESAAIRRELDTIQIPKGDPGLSSIKLNVNNQVRQAMSKFENEVISGHLTVMGAVYDFRNEMKQGQGRLNIINVNGETDATKIAAMEMMKEAPAHKPARAMPRPAPKKAQPTEAESEENPAPAKEHQKPEKQAPSH